MVEKNPIPIYEVVCEECKSKIQYRKSEVHFTGYITCPVCGTSVWAPTLAPVRMETETREYDLISRQDAIDAADKIIERDTSGNNDVVKAMTAWKSFIEQLPSAEPEREKGHWIVHRDWLDKGLCGYECPECGICCDFPTNFCGFCGKPMKMEEKV